MFFEKTFLINLEFKTDRLESFLAMYPSDVLGPVEVVRAVHGDTVTPPQWWHSGNGAWGCYRSHMQILEKCFNENIDSYLVFEDDAVFHVEFADMLSKFMQHVPEDWQQLYIGGQLIHEIKHPPRRINDHVLIPYNVNRTHGFAVHSRGYHALYQHLFNVPFAKHEHIDHHLGRLHEQGGFSVYCPNKWLVGQDAGRSNISGNDNPAMWWADPDSISRPHWLYTDPICVRLTCESSLASSLQNIGWHQGYWKDENGLDRGVCKAMASHKPESKLAQWYEWIRREVVRDNLVVPTLYHPAATRELCDRLGFVRFIDINADDEQDAEQKLDAALKGIRQ